MIYLDSALIEEAKIAISLGWVKGITTNPTLLAKSSLTPEQTLQELAAICPGELYYQLTASTYEDMVKEARKAYSLIGEKTVLKIPATKLGFQVVASLSKEITCSITAIYQASQALVAREAGAKYAIAYVNRTTKLLGDGLKLVREMEAVLKGSNTQILAASLKSPQEATDAIIAGADIITIPLNILQELTTNQLSENTMTEFNSKGIGLNYKL
jgi:transaldolase